MGGARGLRSPSAWSRCPFRLRARVQPAFPGSNPAARLKKRRPIRTPLSGRTDEIPQKERHDRRGQAAVLVLSANVMPVAVAADKALNRNVCIGFSAAFPAVACRIAHRCCAASGGLSPIRRNRFPVATGRQNRSTWLSTPPARLRSSSARADREIPPARARSRRSSPTSCHRAPSDSAAAATG